MLLLPLCKGVSGSACSSNASQHLQPDDRAPRRCANSIAINVCSPSVLLSICLRSCAFLLSFSFSLFFHLSLITHALLATALKAAILKSGVVRPLLKLAMHPGGRIVHRPAAVAIAGLAIGDPDPCLMKQALVEMGCIPPLVEMVRIEEEGGVYCSRSIGIGCAFLPF